MSDKEQPLIILKRIEEVAEAKKGGVWKIAHADFMTAMMAFFLIMWLVNATDEEIKKSIANYFNPMNLMAAPSDQHGIDDPTKDTSPPASGDQAGQRSGTRPLGADSPGNGGGANGGGNVEEGNQNHMDSSGILAQTDNAAFNDPYASVASAQAQVDPDTPVAVDVPQDTVGDAARDAPSEAQRDPFDPTYWQTPPKRAARSLRPGRTTTADAPPPDARLDAADARPTETPTGDATREAADAAASESIAAHQDAPTSSAAAASAAAAGQAPAPRSAVAAAVMAEFGEAPKNDASADAAAFPAAARLKAEAEAIAKELGGGRTDVAVAPGSTSVLISLTDDRSFSMFAIGSAVPTTETAALFAKVAKSLAARDGRIVVRGHTDARPYASGASDNWVLSFQRAYATKKALVDNGVAEARIARVEGLADREPSNAGDPLAAENRRIEILYEPAGATP